MTSRRRKALARALGTMAASGLLITFAPAAAHAATHVATHASAHAATHASAHAASASTAYRSIALPVPAGTTESSVLGGDPTGRYLVGVGYHQGGSNGLLWVDGRLKRVNQSSLSPYVQVQFDAVNSQGVFVGLRTTDDTSFHTDAFVYRHGRFTLLPAPDPGDPTSAVAIDARGDIVGDAIGPDGWEPVEWPANRPGSVRVLPTPGDGWGFATGVDEDGTVVGYLNDTSSGIPYVWPSHGRPHALPVPAGSGGGFAEAVRRGWVAGDVFDPATGSTEPAEWNLRTGSLKTWPDVEGQALSVNRWGTIGVAGGAIVQADGRVVPIAGWVYTVSDRGTAAGTDNNETGHAVLWLAAGR